MQLLPFDEYVTTLNRKRMAAGVLFRDVEDRVLLVEPSYKPHWDIPGGAVEAGEAPWRTAGREVAEEIGLCRPLGELLVLDYSSDDGPMPEGVSFVFDGGLVTPDDVARLDLSDPEIVSARLCTPAEVRALVKPNLARRLAAALDAATRGVLTLCENGSPWTAPV